MAVQSGLITVMTRAARKAAPRLRRDFGEVEQLQVSRKGPGDFVSHVGKSRVASPQQFYAAVTPEQGPVALHLTATPPGKSPTKPLLAEIAKEVMVRLTPSTSGPSVTAPQ